MKIFLIPWCSIFLLLHDEINAQSSSQPSNLQTSSQFGGMNLFPILQQLPLTFDQHEILHQKAQEEFFRQQKQFQDQLLGSLQQPFPPPTLFPQSNGQLPGLPFLYPTNSQMPGSTSSHATLAQINSKKPNLSVLSPLPTPYQTTQKFDEKSADQMVAQMLHLDSRELETIQQTGESHEHHKKQSEKRSDGPSGERGGERSMDVVARGEKTFTTTSESHDEEFFEENTRDFSTTKKEEKNLDIQKFFHSFGLTAEEKKEIVQRVEQLLKEEIARKILGSVSSELAKDLVISTTTIPTTSPTTTINTVTINSNNLESLSGRGRDEMTQPPHLMSGLIRIREQKDIRESQPKISSLNGSDKSNESDDRTKAQLFDKELKNLGAMKGRGNENDESDLSSDPSSDSSSSRPLQTTDTHLAFNRQKHVEEGIGLPEGIGKIRTRRIRPEMNGVEEVDGQNTAITGKPLDLNEAELVTVQSEIEVSTMNDESTTTASITSTTYEPMSLSANYLPTRIKNKLTAFERLANDYRERLEGTDSVGRLLANFYKDAYIVLRQRDVNSALSRHPQRRNHRKAVLRGRA